MDISRIAAGVVALLCAVTGFAPAKAQSLSDDVFAAPDAALSYRAQCPIGAVDVRLSWKRDPGDDYRWVYDTIDVTVNGASALSTTRKSEALEAIATLVSARLESLFIAELTCNNEIAAIKLGIYRETSQREPMRILVGQPEVFDGATPVGQLLVRIPGVGWSPAIDYARELQAAGAAPRPVPPRPQ